MMSEGTHVATNDARTNATILLRLYDRSRPEGNDGRYGAAGLELGPRLALLGWRVAGAESGAIWRAAGVFGSAGLFNLGNSPS